MCVCVCVCVCARARADRGDVQRQDEHDEEAEVPGQQGAKQHHALLLPEVSVAVEQEEGQEEDHHDLQAQRRPTHPDAAQVTCSTHTHTHVQTGLIVAVEEIQELYFQCCLSSVLNV